MFKLFIAKVIFGSVGEMGWADPSTSGVFTLLSLIIKG